jgi:hypothetical protein
MPDAHAPGIVAAVIHMVLQLLLNLFTLFNINFYHEQLLIFIFSSERMYYQSIPRPHKAA